MTPEERFTTIERLLQASVEHQARQQEQLAAHTQEIEKQNDGIRGLIVVARTCVDSIQGLRDELQQEHKQTMAEISKLREAQSFTDEKLNILIDTIDRMIRHRNGNK